MAHKAEHAVDLETGAIVGVTVQNADEGDTTSSIELAAILGPLLTLIRALWKPVTGHWPSRRFLFNARAISIAGCGLACIGTVTTV